MLDSKNSILTVDSALSQESSSILHQTESIMIPRMSTSLSLLHVLALMAFFHTQSAEGFSCEEGHFVNIEAHPGLKHCEQCPAGKFMEETLHQNTQCIPCSRADDFLHEKEAKPCTSTSDTKIFCDRGYYRYERTVDRFKDAECRLCTDCRIYSKSVKEPCGRYTDAVCI